MFLYFLQKKNFLNNDPHYLHNKLVENQQKKADSFYKDFLCTLFFQGIAKPENERSSEVNEILSKVPYLKGSLFSYHYVEEMYGSKIQIGDAAFEKLFKFFEMYQWHLDERPLREDDEINPDVLGYIFEKYINQRQMGAYYTKDDITDYISKATIIPLVFEKVEKSCNISFKSNNILWHLLRDDPNRYIYPGTRKGIELSLPPEILISSASTHRHTKWNKLAPEVYALPGESWREVIIRRQEYEVVRKKIENGAICCVDDFITNNLDLRQFAQDIIENCENPELLRAFYEALATISVLDPTCGSGAFLFTALNILEPLYEACLDRMQSFLNEFNVLDKEHIAEAYVDFRKILTQVKEHPNRRYFVLKSIMLNNLFGVDIMEEAVEICKLRLYLKLVAQLEYINDIEPLPDIDFNIRAGNTLVGFANYDELKRALSSQFDFDNTLELIERKAETVDQKYQEFRRIQTQHIVASGTYNQVKSELRKNLNDLVTEVDCYLAEQYRMGLSKDKQNFQIWSKTHRPFHWFAEFYSIMKRGGFDVIIGNPPYVEYNKVKTEYTLLKKSFQTESCGNLYAFVMERNELLLSTQGRSGMIIPHSAFCTDRMEPIIKLFQKRPFWISTYSIRPAKLFAGVDQRLAIYILGSSDQPQQYMTKYHCWNEDFRPFLFQNLHYFSILNYSFENSYPKVSSLLEESIWKKIRKHKPISLSFSGNTLIYYHNAPRYWIRAMTFPPYFWNERGGEKISSHLKALRFANETDAAIAAAVLNSSLFFWWFILLSNCRDLTSREIERFPLEIANIEPKYRESLVHIMDRLMEDYQKHAIRKEAQYKATGKVIYDEYYPRHSKHIINEIDQILAQHYHFTDEELDFIVNYEIKYRMGRDKEGD
ncbi:hypothetical protein KDW_08580 [Dictyobacter vulcani]|uniref:site-specific DNA-methyltransferase (adenine-specific) n=2 Tax=Dictyobacter vulcani TaxID=2607529 RepID=A0A5J4KNB9_9CHLR|nr:hypothetical protein KDW_08580 [Dictyobacter vulcani]